MCRRGSQCRQQGSVAIVVALSLLVLVGFAGLVLDLGRLYVNRSELQSAADACALAAAAELTCDTSVAGACTPAFLQRAETIGIFVAGKNQRDLQAHDATIVPADVKFSTTFAPNSNYLPRASNPSPASKFVMCTARSNGILPWFMGALGVGASDVNATAVATLGPTQNFCSVVPMGLCSKTPSYVAGQWVSEQFSSGGNGDNLSGGSFRWVDFTPNAGGSSEIREQLAGTNQVCNLSIGSNIAQPGAHQGAKAAYNTRFGLYQNGANAYTALTAAPDRTGYAYPNKAPGNPVIAVGTSALSDYLSRQGSNTGFIDTEYGVSGPGGNIPGTPSSTATHQTLGKERRLVTVPVIDCNAGNTVPIQSMACVLMLNPMSNGASGTIYLEYVGLADASGSPCRSSGTPGGGGPLAPVLVQ